MTQENFIRHTLIATVEGHSVFITIKWHDGKLSISGVEGPRGNGDAWGSCGQIVMGDWSGYKAHGDSDLDMIKRLWDRWHLNDMQAGDAVQMAWLRENGHGKDYTETCKKLEAVGLLTHDGYKYGSKWLRVEVPWCVVAYFHALPEDGEKMPVKWRT